jgi:hypothetical protein
MLLSGPLLFGALAGVIAFLGDLALIYYVTGLYTVTSLIAVLSWLVAWYLPYLLGFSLGVGAMVTLFAYTHRLRHYVNSRSAIVVPVAGAVCSSTASLLFACCAPLALSLVSLLGGTAIFLIVNADKLFVLGLALQAAGLLYGVMVLRRMSALARTLRKG